VAEVEFFYGDRNVRQPVGVDWTDRVQSLVDQTGEPLLMPVWVRTEDGLVMQCTPENFRIYRNRVSPMHDMLAVLDPRDGMWFNLYRERFENANIDFEKFCSRIGHAAIFMLTTVPMPGVEDTYEKFVNRDVEECESFPEEWDSEV
jgi:hypothetical protein